MDGVGRSAIEKRPRQRERAWRPGGSCAPGSPVEPWKPLLAWALAKLLPPAVEWLPCPVKPVPASEKIWLVSGGARASQQPTLGRAVNPAVSEHTGGSTIFLLQRPKVASKPSFHARGQEAAASAGRCRPNSATGRVAGTVRSRSRTMIFAGLVPHSSVAAQCGLGVRARAHFHHPRRHWGAQDHLRQRVRKASLVQLKFVAPARQTWSDRR